MYQVYFDDVPNTNHRYYLIDRLAKSHMWYTRIDEVLSLKTDDIMVSYETEWDTDELQLIMEFETIEEARHKYSYYCI